MYNISSWNMTVQQHYKYTKHALKNTAVTCPSDGLCRYYTAMVNQLPEPVQTTRPGARGVS